MANGPRARLPRRRSTWLKSGWDEGRCPSTQAMILGQKESPICSFVACDHSAQTALCQTPIHKPGSSQWASEQSVRLYRSRQARHKDVVREGEQRLDHSSQRLAAVGS